jgi:hypothetical protein
LHQGLLLIIMLQCCCITRRLHCITVSEVDP